MGDNARPFGAQLYEELKREGRGTVITTRMDYEGIQLLKVADREETVRLFHGSNYEVLQRIRSDSAADVASYLIDLRDEAARVMSTVIAFYGAVFS